MAMMPSRVKWRKQQRGVMRGNATRGLPLVDAEVGALLRVLATTVGATRILEMKPAEGKQIGAAITDFRGSYEEYLQQQGLG